MNREQIKIKIIEILELYGKDNHSFKELSEDTRLLADLNINSSRLVDLVLALEDKFEIEIEDEELGKASTFGSLIQLVESKKLG